MTVGDMVRRDTERAALKPRTRRMRRSTWRCHGGDLDGRDPAGVRTHEIEEWYRLQAARHPYGATQALAVLSAAWSRAERREEAPPNPCIGVRRVRLPGRQRFLSADEYRALGAALDADGDRHEVAVSLIRFLAVTGLREAEGRTLRERDVRDGAAHLVDSKTGPRTVWLPAPAAVLLERRRNVHRDGEWLFPARHRRSAIGYETVQRTWRRVTARAGLHGLRLHDLRHSYASAAVEIGTPVATVQRLLGHGDIRTTMNYVHSSPAAAARAVEAVAEVAA